MHEMLSINLNLISKDIFHFFTKNYRHVISTTLPLWWKLHLWLQSTIDMFNEFVN